MDFQPSAQGTEECDGAEGQAAARTRPNLSKACRKTKLCSFHLRGQCRRGQDCTFAHDPSELQSAPDLSRTKLCPGLLKHGRCSKKDGCKFAHTEEELREITSKEQAAADEPEPKSKTAPPVVSELNQAVKRGAVKFGGMVEHLTGIFAALYASRPELEARVGMTAEILAEGTVKQAWADAGLGEDSLMTFGELVRWCRLGEFLLPKEQRKVRRKVPKSDKTPKGDIFEPSTDSDTWSMCSTDDGSPGSSPSFGSRTSTISDDANVDSQETSTILDDEDDEAQKSIVTVQNTFIHVVASPSVSVRQRSKSVPSHVARVN